MAAKAIADRGSSIDDGSDRDPCPICLGPILQESYLDTCFHKFCFNCIKQWIKVVSCKVSKQVSSVKCPLCKTDNFSIIHNYDGHYFERHYVDRNITDGFVLSKEQRFRLQCYYTESGFLADVFDVPRFWKLKKLLQPNRWLEAWLRRELQALMQDEDVDIVLHHLVGVMDSFCKRTEGEERRKQEARSTKTYQEQFKAAIAEAARPFLMARTDRFVDEVELFLASGMNMEAYDTIYKQRLGWNNPREMGVANEAREEEEEKRRRRVTPYLFLFEEDSD